MITDVVSNTSIFFFILIILKFTLLNQVLSQIRSLSVVTHLMLIPINIPGTVMFFYAKIFDIVKFDILEDLLKFDVLLAWIFNFDDEPVRSAAALGYSSHYIITNLGPIFIFFVLLLVLQFIYGSIITCRCGMSSTNRFLSFAND